MLKLISEKRPDFLKLKFTGLVAKMTNFVTNRIEVLAGAFDDNCHIENVFITDFTYFDNCNLSNSVIDINSYMVRGCIFNKCVIDSANTKFF